MDKSFTLRELAGRLEQLKATTSVAMPMGYYIFLKILLHRRKENFSSWVYKAIIGELEKQPNKTEAVTRDEVVAELRSLKKALVAAEARERLGIKPEEVLIEEKPFGKYFFYNPKKPQQFLTTQNMDNKEEAPSKREMDQYIFKTLQQFSDRLSEIEKRQIDSSRKAEDS